MKFLIFATIITISQALILNCKFEMLIVMCEVGNLCTLYSCNAEIEDVVENRVVTAVNGLHIGNYTNNEVGYLEISGTKRLSYFPKGVEKFFPFLKGIYITANLKTLNGDELKPFANLTQLVIAQNQNLEKIPGNLFDNNPMMESIWFNSNKIKYVGDNLLNSLSYLRRADFSNNICTNENASNKSELVDLMRNLKTNCG